MPFLWSFKKSKKLLRDSLAQIWRGFGIIHGLAEHNQADLPMREK